MQFKDLIKELATRADITQTQAKEIYGHLVDIVNEELTGENSEISLPRLANFSRSLQPARTGRNPATGEEVAIPERYRIKVTPNASLKRTVRELDVA